jgi:hypothetical protein
MEKLLEIRVGEGRVQSGLLPLDAVELLESLLAALSEEGADPEVLKNANPHISILGAGSIRAALFTDGAKSLKESVSRFQKRARAFSLGPKGREFADRATSASNSWGYLDLVEPGPRGATGKVLRFDNAYREKLNEKSEVTTIEGTDEIYASITRVGGKRPTANLELLSGEVDTFQVQDRKLAKELAKHLYEMVKLKAKVTWDRETGRVISLTVTDLIEEWQDVHLGDLLERHGRRLPIRSDFESVEELIASRHGHGS